MANLQEDFQWPDGIYQWAENDQITGGAEGIDNVPPRQLAGRTQFLAIAKLIMGDVAVMGYKEAVKTVRQRMQEGTVTIYNRGVIRGCTASKEGSGRKVITAAGGIFALGRQISYGGDQAGLTVPANNGASQLTYYAYLDVASNGLAELHITAAGAVVPANGISICRIVVPAGHTASDLAGVTLTDTRQPNADYPVLVSSVPYASVALPYSVIDANYAVYLDITSLSGLLQRETVFVGDKASNGFRIYCEGSIDAVAVKWLAVKLAL